MVHLHRKAKVKQHKKSPKLNYPRQSVFEKMGHVFLISFCIIICNFIMNECKCQVYYALYFTACYYM